MDANLLEKTTKLLSEAKENFNDKSYAHFIEWVNSFNGNEEGKIVRLIYDFIESQSKRPSTMIWRIDDFYEDKIKKYLINNLLPQS
jgi:hypothetical protein